MTDLSRRALASCLGWLLLVCLSGAARAVVADDPLDAVAEGLRPSLIEDIGQALAGAQTLHERLSAHDIEGARKAWIAARIGWERAEVFTGGFVPDLDEKIDSWPNARTGFHAIEARLFSAEEADMAPEANTLVFYLTDLTIKVRDAPLNAQRVLAGTTRLAYEVGEDKADGGESRFSGTSLDDMRNNLIGIQSAYDIVFAGAVAHADAALDKTIRAQIGELKTLLQAPDLKTIDSSRLRAVSEALVLSLRTAAPKVGLIAPTLEQLSQ